VAVTDGHPETRRYPYSLERLHLEQIPEISHNIRELTVQRDRRIDRLIRADVRTFEEYQAIAGEIRGINLAIAAPYAPRSK
jgi:hypothetical protein